MASKEDFVDVQSARFYMAQQVEPVLQDLIAKLAVARPTDVLSFIRDFAIDKLQNEDDSTSTSSNSASTEHDKADTIATSSIPLCCLTGFPAECKVRDRDGNISYYTQDHCDALQRKGRLRWSDIVLLDEEFAPRDNETETEDTDQLELCGDGTALPRDKLDERPVTPPQKGFKMTQPGMNFADSSVTGSAPVGPARYVSYKPQALGSLPEEGDEQSADGKRDGENDDVMDESEKRERATRAAERRQKDAPKVGSDHLFSKEKRSELNQKRKRDDMLGVIAAYYSAMGGSAPFGLAAASDETLQKHFEKCQHAANSRRQEKFQATDKSERETAVASVLGLKSKDDNDTSGQPHQEKQARSFSFEPRALGVIGGKGAGGGDDGDDAVELSADERRQQVRQAALARLEGLAGKAA